MVIERGAVLTTEQVLAFWNMKGKDMSLEWADKPHYGKWDEYRGGNTFLPIIRMAIAKAPKVAAIDHLTDIRPNALARDKAKIVPYVKARSSAGKLARQERTGSIVRIHREIYEPCILPNGKWGFRQVVSDQIVKDCQSTDLPVTDPIRAGGMTYKPRPGSPFKKCGNRATVVVIVKAKKK